MEKKPKPINWGKNVEKRYTEAEELGRVLSRLPKSERSMLLYVAKGVELALNAPNNYHVG